MIRIITSSSIPPKYPVNAPIIVPTPAPIATVPIAIRSVILLPYITRLKISLPMLSVPIRCLNDTPLSFSEAFMAVGS